ncbi:MAG: hypothetical protein Q4B79_00365 [Moraxella sp.]|nr:hypothetical protein [Moraxella sp.]
MLKKFLLLAALFVLAISQGTLIYLIGGHNPNYDFIGMFDDVEFFGIPTHITWVIKLCQTGVILILPALQFLIGFFLIFLEKHSWAILNIKIAAVIVLFLTYTIHSPTILFNAVFISGH